MRADAVNRPCAPAQSTSRIVDAHDRTPLSARSWALSAQGGVNGKADKKSAGAARKAPARRAASRPNLLAGGNSKSERTSAGVMHEAPADVLEILASDPDLQAKWNDLTPIQRNEWVCWVTIVKKKETRAEHVRRLRSALMDGERRPCCWPGCPHRRPKAKKWFRNQ
jgi:hypothetical protein